MNDIIAAEIIDEELKNAEEVLNNITESDEYSKISTMTKNIEEETEKLVSDNSLPNKDIVSDVNTTDIVIDLALASVAKQTSLKLLKLESFLGKIEDQLFKEETIKEMSKADLMNLYATTRMMRSDAFKMLKEIRKETDFAALEATLLSLHSKENMKSEGSEGRVKSVLETIFKNSEFIEKVREQQKEKIDD